MNFRDYSSRNVITPLSSNLSIDEVHLPYLTFLELYKKEITNLLSRMENITINEADFRINMALLEFDKQIYELMKYLIKQGPDGTLPILINRNPSISNPGSLLCMRVTEVKKVYDDYTMAVSVDVLAGLNADFESIGVLPIVM